MQGSAPPQRDSLIWAEPSVRPLAHKAWGRAPPHIRRRSRKQERTDKEGGGKEKRRHVTVHAKAQRRQEVAKKLGGLCYLCAFACNTIKVEDLIKFYRVAVVVCEEAFLRVFCTLPPQPAP